MAAVATVVASIAAAGGGDITICLNGLPPLMSAVTSAMKSIDSREEGNNLSGDGAGTANERTGVSPSSPRALSIARPGLDAAEVETEARFLIGEPHC